MRTLRRLLVVIPVLWAAAAMAQVNARLLRYPDVSATRIAFVYAGDIWLVAKEGGVAERLSTPAGEESFPRFSPDGSEIAYSANYDGNTDIYVVAAGGGLPRRLTYHPSPDRMLDWYPDGSAILFASPMESGKDRFNQLYRLSRNGGLPEKLPVPYGEFGAISADGTTLAYMPMSLDFRTWKRYRGGWTPDIWLFDLGKRTARNLTANVANDAQPMWYGSTVYFLSDRDAAKRANIWAYDLAAGTVREVTHFEEYDVRFPAIGPSDIVFEAAGRLWLLDLATEKAHEVKVEVVTDRATLKPRAENVAKLITNVDLSPSGKRAFVEARGELFSLPAEHGVTMNLTRTSGVAERFPAVSPDGKQIAYFSDRSGEYELTVRPADGSGEERTVTSLGPGFRYRIFWSPDGKKVAFVDQTMAVNVCDVATGKVTPIDKGLYMFEGNLEGFTFSWSADSRWLAYARDTENQQRVVGLYDVKSGQQHDVVSAFYDAAFPTFDPDGKYLYLLTGRSFKPIYSDLDNSWIYANTTNVAAIALRNDVASPLAPRNDVDGEDAKKDEKNDEKAKDKADKDEGKGKGKDKDKAKEAAKEPPKPVTIDLDGFEQRLVALPAEAGNYGGLAAISGKVIYRRLPRTGASDEKSPVVYWDLEEREEKTIVDDVDGFVLSADGKKLLVWKKDAYAIVDVKTDQKLEKKLATADLEAVIDPVAEWRQIFADAWRIERDFFYDPNLHEVDWTAMKQRYGTLLDDAVTRWDVNFVLGELIAELNASHTYRGGGDLEKPAERGVGLLGRRLHPRERRLPHPAHPRRRRVRQRGALAAQAARCQRQGGRLPAGGQPDAGRHRQGAMGRVRRAGRQDRAADRERTAGDDRRPRGAGRYPRRRLPAAQPGVDRRQAPQGGASYRWPRRLRLCPRHWPQRPDRAGAPVPWPGRHRGADRRRALQLRRADPRPLRRAAQPPRLQLLGGARRPRLAVAAGGARRPQGDADQRLERLGRRLLPVLLPRGGARAADRHADVGRADRDLRNAGAGRRRRRDLADVLDLLYQGRVDHRGARCRPRHRGGRRPGEDGRRRRPAARPGDRRGDAAAAGEPAGAAEASGVHRSLGSLTVTGERTDRACALVPGVWRGREGRQTAPFTTFLTVRGSAEASLTARIAGLGSGAGQTSLGGGSEEAPRVDRSEAGDELLALAPRLPVHARHEDYGKGRAQTGEKPPREQHDVPHPARHVDLPASSDDTTPRDRQRPAVSPSSRKRDTDVTVLTSRPKTAQRGLWDWSGNRPQGAVSCRTPRGPSRQ